jgi:23S rRNA (guanosine2251-2'-O)-methyltransferase
MSRKRKSFPGRRNKHVEDGRSVDLLSEDELFVHLGNLDLPPFVLILDSVQDPHNLGACLRSADGAGVDAVVIPKRSSSPVTGTVSNIACGAAESVPIARVTNLARVMTQLRESGIWLIGTADDTDQSLYGTDLTGPLGIVMGSEGSGLRQLTRKNCDALVAIPMHGRVESLNVSVATGICLYEAVRQRQAKR